MPTKAVRASQSTDDRISMDETSMPYVRIENVVKRYGPVVAVEDLSLTIKKGEILCLLGPSGAGKSTLLNLITGLVQPDEGQILFGDRDVTYETPERRNVGAVFQSFALFPHMSVFDNVAFGLRCQRRPKNEIRERVEAQLDEVGLRDKGRRKPHELSGGERQRVAFARALITAPALLALDEPFGSLDVQLRGTLRTAVRRLVRQSDVPALLITHDRDDAFGVADQVGIIRRGRLLQIGTLRDVYDRPRNAFIARFLGDANLLMIEGDSLRPASPQGKSLMIRPEHVLLRPTDEARYVGTYRGSRHVGRVVRHTIDLDGFLLHSYSLDGDAGLRVSRGDPIGVGWSDEHLVELEDDADADLALVDRTDESLFGDLGASTVDKGSLR